jgi:hypothetical protein
MRELMKTIAIIVFVLTVTMAISGVYLAGYPYKLYGEVLESGIESEFFSTEKVPDYLLAPKSWRPIESVDPVFTKFKTFHFADYDIPLPVHHQEFMLIPVIEEYEQWLSLGALFLGLNRREYVRFRVDNPKPFNANNPKGKIFEIPLLQTTYLGKSEWQFLQDVFSMDIRLPERSYSWWERHKYFSEITWADLVYRLKILEKRQSIFPDSAKGFDWDERHQLGILYLEEFGINDTKVLADQLDPEVSNEMVIMYNNGNLHRLRLRTHLYERTSQHYRELFYQTLRYRESTKESSFPIYAQFKSLSRKDQLDQLGMIYLFSAWTHIQEEEYLRGIIQNIEQGRSALHHLSPLYNYSYRRYGTNFSGFAESLRETEDRKARRLHYEKLQTDRSALESKELIFDPDRLPANERLQHFLREAIDQKLNVDDDELMLIQY